MSYSVVLRPIFPKLFCRKSFYSRGVHIQTSRLVLEEFGDPKKVVKKQSYSVDSSNLGSDDVRKLRLSPIFLSEINSRLGLGIG